jgi:branched-subunit amino acid transport protein AzlD
MMVLLLTMTLISFSMRMLPFFLAKWLDRFPLLKKITAGLPLCISILLVAHLLENENFKVFPYGLPELSGVAAVAAAHYLWRNLLLSMGIGVLIQQMVLYLI